MAAVKKTAKAKTAPAKTGRRSATPKAALRTARKTAGADVERPAEFRKRNRPEYGSDAIAEMLRGFGFEYAFLNPGSSFRGLQDSLVNYNGNVTPKVVLGLHEDNVTAMAQGYATASGRPALCILHNLVGLLHGAMGIFNIYTAGMPVLVLGGSGPSDMTRRGPVDYTHSANTQGDAVRAYVKWDDEATTVGGVIESVLRGYKIANTVPKGPCYIAFDSGLQEQAIDSSLDVPDTGQSRYQPPAPPAASAEAVDQAADMLVKARYPLIIGGRVGYLPDATGPIRELVELLGAAYSDDRTFVAMPTRHPQNLTGSRDALPKADLILTIDCADVHWAIGGYRNAGRKTREVIDLSLNEATNKRWVRTGGPIADTSLQVMADPLTGLAQLTEAVKKRIRAKPELGARFARRAKAIAREKATLTRAQERQRKARWNETPISPERMVAELFAFVRDKPWYLTLRNHRSWPEGAWEFDGAGQYAGHSSGGGLGHGPGASVGAGFACRDDGRFPIGIIGDGDFMMATGAVWTAVHYKVPLLLVINNNTSWYNDEEAQLKIARIRKRTSKNAYIGTTTRDPDVDIVKVSEGYGAWAAGPVTDPNDLADVYKRAVRVVEDGGVAVVDIRTANL